MDKQLCDPPQQLPHCKSRSRSIWRTRLLRSRSKICRNSGCLQRQRHQQRPLTTSSKSYLTTYSSIRRNRLSGTGGHHSMLLYPACRRNLAMSCNDSNKSNSCRTLENFATACSISLANCQLLQSLTKGLCLTTCNIHCLNLHLPSFIQTVLLTLL